jgi:hypothetical protein
MENNQAELDARARVIMERAQVELKELGAEAAVVCAFQGLQHYSVTSTGEPAVAMKLFQGGAVAALQARDENLEQEKAITSLCRDLFAPCLTELRKREVCVVMLIEHADGTVTAYSIEELSKARRARILHRAAAGTRRDGRAS